jgi:hypothetical protein
MQKLISFIMSIPFHKLPKFAALMILGSLLSACNVAPARNAIGLAEQAAMGIEMRPSAEMLAQNDGPYAFYQNNYTTLELYWVCMGNVVNYKQPIDQNIAVECGYQKTIQVSPPPTVIPQVRFQASKVAAISDIHGQFQLLVDLLRNNGVITDSWDWSFGDGHLVIAGDVFDRGPQQTEALWLLYQLDQQATAHGGQVHMLLGNHETMVLYDDLRYLHPKYVRVAEQLNRRFPELYGRDTVLGAWLHSRPVIVTVSNIAFMHGGLHPDYAELGMSIAEINEAYRSSLGVPREVLRETPVLNFLYGNLGPLWYRGYFRPNHALTEAMLNRVLYALSVDHVVLGHTSFPGVYSHWEGRVYNVDADTKRGETSEMLFWEDGVFSKGLLNGQRIDVPMWHEPIGK